MSTNTITVERDEAVAVVTLNRPDALNAINKEMLNTLRDTLQQLDADEDLRSIVLTGAGDGFCAGADLHELQDASPEEARERSETAEEITTLLETTGKLTLAAIHGPCLGGGHEFALACDFRIATENAVLGQPEVRVGLTPGFGATARLPRIIGEARAKSLLLRGEKISGVEAYDLGLVDGLVEEEEDLMETATQFARDTFTCRSPQAYAHTKKALNQASGESLPDALAIEREHFSSMFGTRDQQEGIAAFLEKCDPDFTSDGEDNE